MFSLVEAIYPTWTCGVVTQSDGEWTVPARPFEFICADLPDPSVGVAEQTVAQTTSAQYDGSLSFISGKCSEISASFHFSEI